MSKRPTRIAVDARYFAKRDTGIYLYLCATIQLLLDQGFEVTLVSPTALKVPAEIVSRCQVVVLPYGKRKLDSAWTQIALVKFLRGQNFDYYFVPANRGLPVFYFGKTKLILTVQDVIPLHFFGLYFRRQPVETLSYLLSIFSSVRKADRIMAVSQSTARDLWHFFRRRATPTLIPIRYMGLKERKSKNKKKQFVYNGGRDPRKNVPLLLEAFAEFHKQYPKYKLILMGGGYEAYDDEIARLGIPSAVQKTGYVSQEEKMRILAESAATVYPSLTEGYGLPIVEALSVGTPIICGTGGSQREIAGKAGVFLEPIAVKTIKAAMVRVATEKLPKGYAQYEHDQLAYLLSAKHEQRIIDHFTASQTE